ncbi:MAG: hypothetical protein NVS1B13_11680 [Flavisolibacter sp.]
MDFNVPAYWVKYSLKNEMPKPASISLAAHSEESKFYVIKGTGLTIFSNGWLSHCKKRDGYKITEMVPITIKPFETVTIYNKIYNARNVLKPSLLDVSYSSTQKTAAKENALLEVHYKEGTINAIFFGALFIIFSLNFISYLFLKDKTYLYFGLYVLTEGFVEFQNLREFIFTVDTRMIFTISLLFYPLQFFFLVNFARHFLNTSKYAPKWDKMLTSFSIIPLISLVAGFFITPHLHNPHSDLFRHVSTAFFCAAFILVFLTFLLHNYEKNKTVAAMIRAAIPAMFFWALLYSLTGLFQFLHSWYNITTPALVEKLQLLYPYINKILIFYFSIFLSITLFLRYNNLREQITHQLIEKERLENEAGIERERNKLIGKQKKELEEQVGQRTAELQKSLENLKAAQGQLVQSEKMASLGELTAGIAHEIQNPLNFVNNFSEVSVELAGELKEEIKLANIDTIKMDTINHLVDSLGQNQEKIMQHGKRADAIVKSMLMHSRKNTGTKEQTDLNELLDEYLRLSYHGLRAKEKSFNAQLITDFDKNLPKVLIVPQDIGRVVLNMFNNAFYSITQKKKLLTAAYNPVVSVATRKINQKITITITDNGLGISKKILDKIYHPFFTTKPSGEGTGLGLSLSYDIIKAHNGDVSVETVEGEFATFIITLQPEFTN